MIFFDQLIVSSVKFGKCFAEFMILIALLLGLDGYEFITNVEVRKMRYYSKANAVIYIDTLRGTLRDIPIKVWKFFYIKIILFITCFC